MHEFPISYSHIEWYFVFLLWPKFRLSKANQTKLLLVKRVDPPGSSDAGLLLTTKF